MKKIFNLCLRPFATYIASIIFTYLQKKGRVSLTVNVKMENGKDYVLMFMPIEQANNEDLDNIKETLFLSPTSNDISKEAIEAFCFEIAEN